MRSENGTIENLTTLAEDMQLNGIWVGDCTVTKGAHLQLNGTVTGDLTVTTGATATVRGTVAGQLTALGSVHVEGVVCGTASGPGITVATGAQVSRTL